MKTIYIALVSLLLIISTTVSGQTTTQDGDWITGATWGGTSPGYTGLNTPTVSHDVESASGLTFANSNGRTLTVSTTGTLVVRGDVTFAANKNFAEITVQSGGTLIIFGTLDMGKNNAGVTVEAGGVLVVTGDVVDNGGGGNSIDAVGDVYVGGSSGDVGGTGTVKPIEELSDDGFTDVENFVNDVEAGGVDFPLPVELIFFKAQSNNTVALEWATATEINNSYFVIERSEDGVYFYEIGKVEGNGNSNEVIEYSFEDKFTLAPVEYYRLQQVDYDGQNEYFSAVRVETNVTKTKKQLSVYPTIVSNQKITIKSNAPFELKQITIYDIAGSSNTNLINDLTKENMISYSVNLSSFKRGYYIVRTESTSGEIFNSRIFIK